MKKGRDGGVGGTVLSVTPNPSSLLCRWCDGRLALEVKEVVKAHPSLQRISFVGNSLGGLYSRYALKELWDEGSRTIAGCEPVTFMTIASPHLGVRKHLGLPFPRPLHFMAPVFLGQTGEDLFLRGARPPLLVRMATEPAFLRPLEAFKHRR